jgi:hypothetical protein
MSGRYTVISQRGCKVIEGAVPITEFVALVGAFGADQDPADEWIVDTLLAQYLDANFVLGPASVCEAWRAELGFAMPPKRQP